jgi:hypothetical protein
VNFSGNNYIVIELPYFSTQAKKKFKHHCIVMGGHRDSYERANPKEEPNFTDIHFVDTNNLEQTITLAEKFKLSPMLPDMVDQLTVILRDPKTKNYYLRATYPLKAPVELPDCYVHYVVLQFGLSTGLIEIIPGRMDKK